jgi:hypothetical protein
VSQGASVALPAHLAVAASSNIVISQGENNTNSIRSNYGYDMYVLRICFENGRLINALVCLCIDSFPPHRPRQLKSKQ